MAVPPFAMISAYDGYDTQEKYCVCTRIASCIMSSHPSNVDKRYIVRKAVPKLWKLAWALKESCSLVPAKRKMPITAKMYITTRSKRARFTTLGKARTRIWKTLRNMATRLNRIKSLQTRENVSKIVTALCGWFMLFAITVVAKIASTTARL